DLSSAWTLPGSSTTPGPTTTLPARTCRRWTRGWPGGWRGSAHGRRWPRSTWWWSTTTARTATPPGPGPGRPPKRSVAGSRSRGPRSPPRTGWASSPRARPGSTCSGWRVDGSSTPIRRRSPPPTPSTAGSVRGPARRSNSSTGHGTPGRATSTADGVPPGSADVPLWTRRSNSTRWSPGGRTAGSRPPTRTWRPSGPRCSTRRSGTRCTPGWPVPDWATRTVDAPCGGRWPGAGRRGRGPWRSPCWEPPPTSRGAGCTPAPPSRRRWTRAPTTPSRGSWSTGSIAVCPRSGSGGWRRPRAAGPGPGSSGAYRGAECARSPSAEVNAQASRTTVRRSGREGRQPSSRIAFSLEATRTAGSPGRRGATTSGIGCPVTSTHVDHLADGESLATAQVEDPVHAGPVGLQRQHVGVGQVGHVDVVAHARAVGGRPVVAEHLDVIAVSQRHLQHQREEMRLDLTVLACAPVRAGHVEVPQAGRGHPVHDRVGRDGVVDRELSGAVGVGGPGGHVLGDGDLFRLAVRGRCRREHQVVHAGGAHRVEHRQRAGDVALPVLAGPGHGLADQGPGGEVHHAVERRVEDLAGEPGDVPLDERRARRYRVPVPGREVVDDDHLVSPLEQYGRAHAADVARASGDEQLHGRSSTWMACAWSPSTSTVHPSPESRATR